MRHPYEIERMEAPKDAGFDGLYRRYVRACLDAGIKPMCPDDVVELLPIFGLADTRTQKAAISH